MACFLHDGRSGRMESELQVFHDVKMAADNLVQCRCTAPDVASVTSGDLVHWRRLMESDQESIGEGLRDLYRTRSPQHAELIFTGACEFACRHCIYPPQFARHNASMPIDRWSSILSTIHADFGICSFVYNGRAVTHEGVRTLRKLRTDIPGASIGLIDNAISILPHLDELTRVQLDWIDVSFDGTRDAHDRQRGRVGSFDAALHGALELKERRLATRLNVLTCLTSINASTVTTMAIMLNQLGFKNFFLTPMGILRGVWPPSELSVGQAAVTRIVREYLDIASRLDDAYVEVGVFEPAQFADIARASLFGGEDSIQREDHLGWQLKCGTTTVAVRYWPASLAGLREFIVNTDGRVLLPKAMAYAQIPPEASVGDLCVERPRDIWRRLPDSPRFAGYLHELELERRLLQDLVG